MQPPAAGEAAGELPADGGGKAMPADVQAKMESAFGADFSGVRIHEGPRSSAMGALAHAQGSDIHFAPGQYDPTSQHGQELLGHELAHVVQQAQGRVPAIAQASGAPWNADPALEHEADALGIRAARGERMNAGAVIVPATHSAQAPVQARLPDRSYEGGLTTHEPEHANSNLQGIQNLLVRMYNHDLSPTDRGRLETSCRDGHVNLLKAIYAAPSEDTRHAYNWACHLFPLLIYPGHEVSREPKNEQETLNRAILVDKVREVIAWMCGSGSDSALASVFGHDRVGDARKHANQAMAWVAAETFAASLGVDRTRESEEMMIGAHARFGGPISLRPDDFAQPPSNDLVAKVTHEAFHAADSTVLDDGGYPGAPEDFKRRSPDEKLVNASHYEEVARRFLKASPVGGDFEPAVRKEQGHDGTMMEVDTRTPLQQATDRVRHTVQLAWERCQNVHGFLKSLVHKTYESDKMNEHMRAEVFKPLFYWSRLLHLQIHDRFVEAHKARVTVNYIDLLQVESLTRSIGRMMKTDLVQLLDQTPIHAQKALNLSNAQFAKLIVDHLLIVLVNQHADARWLKPDAFKGMIEELSVAPQDVSKVTG